MIRDTSAQDEVIPQIGGFTRNRLLVIGIVAIALIASVVAYPGYSRWVSAEQSVSRDRLRLATVRQGDLTRDISAQGKVIAAIKPTLFSEARGVVTLSVQAGDSVDEGETVALIESPELLNLLAQETASLSSAETNFKRQQIEARKTELENQQKVGLANLELVAARRELRRAQAAHDKDAISEFDYDMAADNVASAELKHVHAAADAGLQQESLQFELQTTQIDIDGQRLAMKELQRQVQKLTILSPVTGIVGNLLVENRDAVAQNQPLLTVVDLSAFEVELQVPDSYASALVLGLDAEVSHQGLSYAATLVSVSPEVINSQITAKVRFTGRAPENMKQNQRVSARILLEGKADVLLVERGPFLESGGGRMAYVVEDNLARKIRFESGLVTVSAVEVISGLKEGQTIVISSLADFKNSDTVYLAD